MAAIKWYKRDPDAALSGMMQLSLEERGAYNTVLDLIYSRADNLPDDDKFICGFLSVDPRVWRRIKAKLIELGKLTTDGNYIRNSRATREVTRALHRVAVASEAGVISGIIRANKSIGELNENKEIGGTTVPTESERPFELATTTAKSTTRQQQSDSVNGHATSTADVRTELQACDRALREIPGLTDHPVAVAMNIAPIWELIKAGWDLHGHLIPRMTEIVKRTPRGRIKSWSYFRKIFDEDGRPPAAAPPPEISEEKWRTRLEGARRRKAWDYATCGPLPNTKGCRVPTHLLKPDDGQGWVDFKDYRP